jgi:hypothetical protein
MISRPAGPENAKVPWREAVRALDSYVLLLVLVLIDYLLVAANWRGGGATVVRIVFVGLTAVHGVHTSGVRGPPARIVNIIAIVAVVGSIINAQVGGDVSKGIVLVAGALLLLATLIAVLRRILQHPQVTAETLVGAICVYLLLGLMFADADLAVQSISGHFFAQPGPHREPAFVYFSFITLTTVGYGDLSPTIGLPRTMAITEALVGQIFLVVLVARLVSSYIPGSGETRRQIFIQSHATRRADPATAGEEQPYETEEDTEH